VPEYCYLDEWLEDEPMTGVAGGAGIDIEVADERDPAASTGGSTSDSGAATGGSAATNGGTDGASSADDASA